MNDFKPDEKDDLHEAHEERKREPLPQPGNTLFTDSTNPDRTAFLNLLGRRSTYATAYLMAADLIVDKVRSAPKKVFGVPVLPDEHWLVYPTYFLYRHHLELRLKDLLRVAINSGDVPREHEALLTKSHDISELWRLLMPWVGGLLPPSLAENTNVVTTLADEIGQFDPRAEAGRYSETKDGKKLVSSFAGVEPFDLNNIHDVMHKIFTYLDLVFDALPQQDQREMMQN